MIGRNPTPKDFAFTVALLVGMFLGLCLIAYSLLSHHAISWLYVISFSLLSSILSYFVLMFLLEKFFYRKIKLIYKTIHRLKLGKNGADEREIKLDEDIIQEVNDEVQRWAVQKNREIIRLQEMENFRKDFLGNVFHEIKTPVFSVQGYLYTLKDGAFEDEKVSKIYIDKAVKNIDRLEQIIKDLEVINQNENNRLALDYSKFDINLLVKDVFDTLEYQADIKDIEFGIKPGCDRSFFVFADQEKIRQVLVNLLNNAIKYGKDGGLIVAGFYDMNDNILVEITDNGVGISQEHIDRLFERFYRVDKSRYRKDAIGGSGLGLAIVKHIIDAHDQTITVRSTLDVGSTFGFTLQKAKQ